MATGSRGAGRDVDNDNVTPNQPALKNGAGHTHMLAHTHAKTHASLLEHL